VLASKSGGGGSSSTCMDWLQSGSDECGTFLCEETKKKLFYIFSPKDTQTKKSGNKKNGFIEISLWFPHHPHSDRLLLYVLVVEIVNSPTLLGIS